MTFLQRKLGGGIILIVGMPRSGTTWLGKIFDSHPDVLYRHEPDSIVKLGDNLSSQHIKETPLYRKKIRHFASHLNQLNHVTICAKSPYFKKAYLTPGEQFIQLGAMILAKAAKKVFSYDMPVFAVTWNSNRSEVRWVWKSIELLSNLNIIRRSLPQSYSFHIIRHPCGYIASVLKGKRQSRFNKKYTSFDTYGISKLMIESNVAHSYGMTLEKLKALSIEERLAWRWVITNEKAIVEQRGDKKNLLVKYEALCSNPITVAKYLFKHAGLSWQPQTERFIHLSTSCNSKDYYSVYKNPLDVAERWRKDLSQDQIGRILDIIKGTLPGQHYC